MCKTVEPQPVAWLRIRDQEESITTNDIIAKRWRAEETTALYSHATVEALRSERDALREALEPFAAAGGMALISGRPPGEHVDANAFMRARAALASTGDQP